MQDHQDLINDFNWAGKIKQAACKTLRVWIKNEENFEKFQENFEIFWSKSLWKINFFTFVTKYFLDFWLPSESIDLWKITPDFYNNFSDFGEGERSGVPPLPTPLDCVEDLKEKIDMLYYEYFDKLEEVNITSQ